MAQTLSPIQRLSTTATQKWSSGMRSGGTGVHELVRNLGTNRKAVCRNGKQKKKHLRKKYWWTTFFPTTHPRMMADTHISTFKWSTGKESSQATQPKRHLVQSMFSIREHLTTDPNFDVRNCVLPNFIRESCQIFRFAWSSDWILSRIWMQKIQPVNPTHSFRKRASLGLVDSTVFVFVLLNGLKCGKAHNHRPKPLSTALISEEGINSWELFSAGHWNNNRMWKNKLPWGGSMRWADTCGQWNSSNFRGQALLLPCTNARWDLLQTCNMKMEPRSENHSKFFTTNICVFFATRNQAALTCRSCRRWWGRRWSAWRTDAGSSTSHSSP